MKVKLNLIAIFILSIISINAYSQGWVGNGGNNLIGYNSSTNLTPLNIGIGTNAPSAVLHTVGDLRFQNLQQANANFNRLLSTDVNGVVRWIDLNSVTGAGSDNDWLTVGSNAVPGNINDNIFTLGTVGVNTNNPFAQLTVIGTVDNLSFGIRQGLDGINGGMYIDGPNAQNSGRIYFTGNLLKIGRANNNNPNQGNAITVDPMDNVGIRLLPGSTPTASLHTLGDVRFEDLPAGGGRNLVVDGNGNVMVSDCTCPSFDKSIEQDEVQELMDRINDLEKEMEVLKKIALNSEKKEKDFSKDIKSANLGEDLDNKVKIYPNPGSGLFTLDLNGLNPDNLNYNIVNALGVSVSQTTTEVTSSKNQIDLSAFVDGIYYLSIYQEDQLLMTKQLILNK